MYFKDIDCNVKEVEKMEKELQKLEGKKEIKKATFKGAARAVSLATRLSPKNHRHKQKASTIAAHLKVKQLIHRRCLELRQ